MLGLFLSSGAGFLVLKWLSQALIVTSGIYAMFSDLYKQDDHTKKRRLTRAGWVNLTTLLIGFVLFGVTDYRERAKEKEDEQAQQKRYDDETARLGNIVLTQKAQVDSQTQELKYLHHLILVQESVDGWEISWHPPAQVITAARSKVGPLANRYLQTCLKVTSISARKSSDEHWVITCTLGRPQGILENLTFDLSPTQPEWSVFESVLDVLLSARFSISQTGGETFVLLTRLERPDQISFDSDKIVIIIRNSRVKLSRLEQPVQAELRIDAENPSDAPTAIRIRSLDPNVKLDQTVRTNWKKRQVATKPNFAEAQINGEVIQEPVFAFFSGPHELRASFNPLLFSFEKPDGAVVTSKEQRSFNAPIQH